VSVIAVIPARYGSSRFPGKLLARETGKFLIQHVYERVCLSKSLNRVLIATDDERIGRACDGFSAEWRMTRLEHPSGTDRIAEAAGNLETDILVNVQGDEPEIEPENIDVLVELLRRDTCAEMATLCSPIREAEEVDNPNVVKVVCSQAGRALYFSRYPIPYYRGDGGVSQPIRRKHLGIYAYRKESLLKLSRLSPTPLELAEKLEQLRALENGMTIAVGEVEHPAVGIDTPEQYAEFVKRYQQSMKTNYPGKCQ